MGQKSLFRNYILNMIRTVSGLIFPLITFMYASRTLGVEGIGKVDFAKSIVSYYTLFATLGISTYGIREGAKVRDNRYQLSKLVKELLCINLITTIITYIVFIATICTVSKLSNYRLLLLINGLTIGFTSLGLEWLYSAVEDFDYITIRYIIIQIISLALLFLLVKGPNDCYKYALIVTLSSVGSNVFNFIHARKYLEFSSAKMELKKHLKPILIFFSNTVIGNIYVTLDTSMLGLLSNDNSVGLYSAAIKMNRICVGIITAFSTVLLPRLSYYVEKRDYKTYDELLKRSMHIVFMIALPMVCGMLLLSKEVLVLFSGSEFIEASTCSRILAIIVFAIPISTFATQQILIPFGKERYIVIGAIVGALSNLVANSILITKYNQDGAALGTVIAEVLVAIVTVLLSFKCRKIEFIFKGIWHYFFASGIMLLVLFFFNNGIEGIVKCVVFTIVGMFVYIISLFLIKDETFIQMFHLLIRKLKLSNN